MSLLALLFLFVGSFALTVDELLKQGDQAFIAKSSTAALSAYTKAIELEPDNYRAWYKRASVNVQLGKKTEALYDLNQVLQINPSYHMALVTRGKLNKEFGKFASARQDLEIILESKKSSMKDKAKQELTEIEQLEASMKSGNEFLAQGRFKEAKAVFSQVISTAPSWVLPRLARARVSYQAGDYKEVIEDTLRLLKVTKNDVEAILLRGLAFKYLGDLDAADKHYDNCLMWESTHSECLRAKSELKAFETTMRSAERRIEAGHGKLALADIDTCLQMDEKLTFFKPKLLLLKCKAFIKAGDPDSALATCDQALKLDESLTQAFQAKGEAYLAKEEYAEAIKQYEKAVNAGDQSAQEGLNNAKKQQKMALRKDYYKILAIPKTASDKDIKKAYRKAAFQYHPDKMSGATDAEKAEAEEKMKDIGEAYAVLSDAEKKGKYDRGEDLDVGGGGGWNPFQGGFQGFQQGGFNFNFGRRG